MSTHAVREHVTGGAGHVSSQGRPTHRARFVDPIVVKQGSIFLLCTDIGDVWPDTDQGLYFHDMRFLSGQTLRLDDSSPISLLADASKGGRALFVLTNADLKDADGTVRLRKELLGIRRDIQLGDDYVERLTVENHGNDRAELTVWLAFDADFADMFAVRGADPGKRGILDAPTWEGSSLTFCYQGADGTKRQTRLAFSAPPDEQHASRVGYRLSLAAHERWELTIRTDLTDGVGKTIEPKPTAHADLGPDPEKRAHQGALGGGTSVETDNSLFNQIIGRSFADLHMLRMRQKDQTFFAAGVPWYVALFGRDSLVTALQVAAYEPDVGSHTLRVLAERQGTTVDDWRDEQPGKILHELRVGEMANLDEIPQTPYFGSVDSTPLFLILMATHCTWLGSLDLFHELRENVRAALDWIDRYGDSDGDGFIDYQTHSAKGSRNQGWKDSENGVVFEDGSLAVPPIALPEVQGDVYLAWTLSADLFRRDGNVDLAQKLEERARRLYAAFNRDFWLSDEGYYAFCRQADGRFSKSIASNPAHALWTGIVDPRRAGAVIKRALESDMFSGWGVRTLSTKDQSYNPIDYQVGSVWPHDNAFIVAGAQRFGLADQACRVFTGIMQAATYFDHFRLPEVFAGYDRGDATQPVKYPVACNPQAWAAGAIPFMLQSILGLSPDGFERRLRISRPCLPDWLRWVNVRNLRIGDATVDLRYERRGDATAVAVERKEGTLAIAIDD